MLKARPPTHLLGVLHQMQMRIVRKSGENVFFTHCQVALDVLDADTSWVDQALLVSLLDIGKQLLRVKIAVRRSQLDATSESQTLEYRRANLPRNRLAK
jgi:hypothetical protein